jgi:hypothetical protein
MKRDTAVASSASDRAIGQEDDVLCWHFDVHQDPAA